MSANTNRAKANVTRVANKTKGYMNKGVNYLKGSNKIVLALVGLFLLLVVGMIVYWIYKAIVKSRKGDNENPILISGSIDASDPANVKSWTLPTSSGSSSPNMAFTLSFWMYIADWYYRVDQPKALLIKGTTQSGSDSNVSPGIWLAPDKNNLLVATSVLGGEMRTCDVANIPIQKWVHVAYVLDNRTVDIYVDCKLERSCVLSGVPLLNNHKLKLFPKGTDGQTGFLGQMSSLRYFSHALRPVDIARLCNEGPHATKGESSKDHHPNDDGGNGECPPRVYDDLHKIKKQLVTITNEVDDAIDAEGENKPSKAPLWDIRVRGRNRPIVRKINSNDGYNGGGGKGLGWQCNSQVGTCFQDGHIGTQGVYEDSNTCNENCQSLQDVSLIQGMAPTESFSNYE